MQIVNIVRENKTDFVNVKFKRRLISDLYWFLLHNKSRKISLIFFEKDKSELRETDNTEEKIVTQLIEIIIISVITIIIQATSRDFKKYNNIG